MKTSDKLETVSWQPKMHGFMVDMKDDANHVFVHSTSVIFVMKIKRKRPLEKHTNTFLFIYFFFERRMYVSRNMKCISYGPHKLFGLRTNTGAEWN